jgi:NADH dehydrogenase FAD-containing subunit
MIMSHVFIPLFDVLTRKFGEKPKPNVIVVGYGWGGKAFCDNIDRSKYNIKVINKTDTFTNTPKLVHFKDLSSVETRIKEYVNMGEVTKIEPQKQTIHLNNTFTYKYDYLVVATGSEVNTFNIEGADTCQTYKTFDDAVALNESLETNTHYQIIGAGPTGIEVAFELASEGKKVTLIEASNTILPNFSDAVREKVLEKLKQRDITLLRNHKVTKLNDSMIETTKGALLRAYTLWMSGIKPLPLVSEINKVDGNLKFNDSTYVIGDSIRGYGPPTAQNAKQQGIYLANHFNNNFKSEPYKYNEWCKMLHTHDALLIDYKNKCYSLPLITSDLIEHLLT